MKPTKFYSHKIASFSLTELLIAMAIVGVLILIALPNLMPLISDAKSTEAKMQLKHVQTLEQRYFYVNSKYTGDLPTIGFEQEKLTTEGGNANYQIEIVESSPSSFKARATSVVDFDQDGTFNVWEIDHEQKLVETVKD